MIFVTACDELYFPGVQALKNSIDRNAPNDDIELWCLVYGSDWLALKVERLGYKVILNPSFPDDTFMPIGHWQRRTSRQAMPAMYSRLLLPDLFPDEKRIFWLDADCIVLQSCRGLVDFPMQGYAFAASAVDWKAAVGDIPENQPIKRHLGACIATMLIDVPTWRSQQVTQRCVDMMNNKDHPSKMRFVVQSVLNYVLAGHFAELPVAYNFNIKRTDARANVCIAHWPATLPWDLTDNDEIKRPEVVRSVQKYWEPYA